MGGQSKSAKTWVNIVTSGAKECRCFGGTISTNASSSQQQSMTTRCIAGYTQQSVLDPLRGDTNKQLVCRLDNCSVWRVSSERAVSGLELKGGFAMLREEQSGTGIAHCRWFFCAAKFVDMTFSWKVVHQIRIGFLSLF